jgi:hypothetical protein
MAELINNVLALSILSSKKFDGIHDWRSLTQLWQHQRYSVAYAHPGKYRKSESKCIYISALHKNTEPCKGFAECLPSNIYKKNRVSLLSCHNHAPFPLLLPVC